MTEIKRHRNFTKRNKQEPVSFTLDNDTFQCVRKMPVEFTKKISRLKDVTGTVERLELFSGLLTDLLQDESLELFNKRLGDKKDPIDVEELSEIIEWLIEVYTGRPLELSQESVPGSMTNTIVNVGTSLTDGAPVETSIPVNSPPIDS
jgi:hypothetical protein